jgi:LSD1 subclass zinc finger protein
MSPVRPHEAFSAENGKTGPESFLRFERKCASGDEIAQKRRFGAPSRFARPPAGCRNLAQLFDGATGLKCATCASRLYVFQAKSKLVFGVPKPRPSGAENPVGRRACPVGSGCVRAARRTERGYGARSRRDRASSASTCRPRETRCEAPMRRNLTGPRCATARRRFPLHYRRWRMTLPAAPGATPSGRGATEVVRGPRRAMRDQFRDQNVNQEVYAPHETARRTEPPAADGG